MRRRTGWGILGGAVLAVAVVGCGGGDGSVLKPPQRPPRAARSVAIHLIARNGKVSTGSLTPAVRMLFPTDAALPPGSKLELDPNAWRQAGRFANSTAELLAPHKPPQHVEVGFMLTTAGWRITFLEDIS